MTYCDDDDSDEDAFDAFCQIEVTGRSIAPDGSVTDFDALVNCSATLLRVDGGWEIDDATFSAKDEAGREFSLPSEFEERVDAMLIEQATSLGG